MLLISFINILFSTAIWYNVIIAVIFCTLLQFVLDGIIAVIINKFPDKHFKTDNHLYDVSEWEKRAYNALKVKVWKDKIWELGGLGGFSKRNLSDPKSTEYIECFIIECNKGVLTHRLSYPIGFLAMLFLPDVLKLSIALPVATVNLFLNVLPTLVLRYNTPKLKLMLDKMKKIESKKAQIKKCKKQQQI